MKRVGYFRVSRDEMEVLGSDGALMLVWVRLLDLAAYGRHSRPWNGRTVELEVGELVTTEDALAASFDGLTRKVVHRCLQQLEQLGWVAQRRLFYGGGRRAAGTVITVVTRAHCGDSQRDHKGSQDPLRDLDVAPPPDDDGTIGGTIRGAPLEEEQQEKKNKNTSPPLPPAAPAAHERDEEEEGERVRDDVYSPGEPDELEVVRYAQMKLARIATAAEVQSFLATWRAAPWLTAAGIRQAADWLAAHPVALRDTFSITRVFHLKKAQGAVAAWDQRMVEHVAGILADGSPPPDLAERLSAQLPSCDREVARVYFERVIARLGPTPREAIRL